MTFDIQALIVAARDTVQQPRAGARGLLNLALPPLVGIAGLALMAVVSALLSAVTFLMSGPEDVALMDPALIELFSNPVQLAISQFLLLIIAAALIYKVGQMFGGKGRLTDAVLLLAWLEFILLLLQILQMLVLLISPSLAGVLGLFGLVLFLWLLANFTAELHGFTSVPAVFLAIIGTVLAISIAVAVVLVAVLG